MTNLYFTLAIYTALAIALGFNLWLYFSVHRRIAALQKQIRSGGNYSGADREQILASHRAGADSSTIAALLNLPKNEVDLTLKLAEPRLI